MSATRGPTATVTVRMPASMKKQLDELAQATGHPRTYLAVDAIRKYLESETWQVAAIREAVRRADAGEFASEQDVAAVREKFRAMGGA